MDARLSNRAIPTDADQNEPVDPCYAGTLQDLWEIDGFR